MPTMEGLCFESQSTVNARTAAFTDFAPVKVKVIELPPSISATEFASAYCLLLATERGHATVVGNAVILKDSMDGLERGWELAQRLQGISVKVTEASQVE